MIVSASYKTDIPAFYGTWFMNRLRAGYCRIVNPYNQRPFTVSLRPGEVEGIVFWTKNIGPFLGHLTDIARDFAFYVQYSVNGYPRELESSVVEKIRSIEHIRQIQSQFGTPSIVWRYDPVLFSSFTPASFHIENFSDIAQQLAGVVDEVVISFAQVYAKTERNLTVAARAFNFNWRDPEPREKFDLATQLTRIAESHSIQLTVCSQKDFVVPGAKEAHCIDIDRLGRMAGRLIRAELKGNRPECACYASKDIGDYDTCPHGCVYCYAVKHRSLARRRFSQHNPQSEFLFEPDRLITEPGTLPLFS